MEKNPSSLLKEIYKKRNPQSRKYDFGLLVVIGGSDFYSGSPALSAFSAFRAGADMVRIIAPKRAADITASFSPDLAAYPLEGKWLNKSHLSILKNITESANIVSRGNVAVLIGGGMGRSEETQETILEFLSDLSLPAVIDADAIHAVAKKPEIINGKNFLITPHYFEFFTLTGKEVYQLSEEEKTKAVLGEAQRLKTTILLKGEKDIVSDGQNVLKNTTGSPYLTVGGCGDTLAGIAGALLARKISSLEAGYLAAYINGSAGALAAEKKKDSLMATDLINEICNIINQ